MAGLQGDAVVEDARADLPPLDELTDDARITATNEVAPRAPKPKPQGRDPLTALDRSLHAHTRAMETHTQAMETAMRALADAGTSGTSPVVPGWLRDALGNPNTYDAPDPLRVNVHVRVVPALHARVQRIQARLGVRTAAGAWESVLRLGLAAAERLPG